MLRPLLPLLRQFGKPDARRLNTSVEDAGSRRAATPKPVSLQLITRSQWLESA